MKGNFIFLLLTAFAWTGSLPAQDVPQKFQDAPFRVIGEEIHDLRPAIQWLNEYRLLSQNRPVPKDGDAETEIALKAWENRWKKIKKDTALWEPYLVAGKILKNRRDGLLVDCGTEKKLVKNHPLQKQLKVDDYVEFLAIPPDIVQHQIKWGEKATQTVLDYGKPFQTNPEDITQNPMGPFAQEETIRLPLEGKKPIEISPAPMVSPSENVPLAKVETAPASEPSETHRPEAMGSPKSGFVLPTKSEPFAIPKAEAATTAKSETSQFVKAKAAPPSQPAEPASLPPEKTAVPTETTQPPKVEAISPPRTEAALPKKESAGPSKPEPTPTPKPETPEPAKEEASLPASEKLFAPPKSPAAASPKSNMVAIPPTEPQTEETAVSVGPDAAGDPKSTAPVSQSGAVKSSPSPSAPHPQAVAVAKTDKYFGMPYRLIGGLVHDYRPIIHWVQEYQLLSENRPVKKEDGTPSEDEIKIWESRWQKLRENADKWEPYLVRGKVLEISSNGLLIEYEGQKKLLKNYPRQNLLAVGDSVECLGEPAGTRRSLTLLGKAIYTPVFDHGTFSQNGPIKFSGKTYRMVNGRIFDFTPIIRWASEYEFLKETQPKNPPTGTAGETVVQDWDHRWEKALSERSKWQRYFITGKVIALTRDGLLVNCGDQKKVIMNHPEQGLFSPGDPIECVAMPIGLLSCITETGFPAKLQVYDHGRPLQK